jgi:hypothetical protein
MALVSSTHTPKESRPPTYSRQSMGPSVMSVNGHFSSVGEAATTDQYDHGIQIIDEDQNFK